MTIDPRRHQAVHEAGHAVIGIARGLQVEEVGFNAEDADAPIHFPASTRFVGGDPCELISAEPELMIVVMLAGSVAEKVVLGDILANGYQGDLGALELCYPDFPDDPKKLLGDAMREALELINEHRREIAALADQLLIDGRLAGEDIERIIAAVREAS
jgi:ATP-dependent Zn protease